MIPRSGWILTIIWLSVTIYLLRDLVYAVLDLSHSYSQPFLSTAMALLFFQRGAWVKIILLLDFFGFILTQAFQGLRYMLLGTLSNEEFNLLQVDFTYFIAPKLFFVLCCQPEFCIYETSIWVLWFGFVLFVRMLHQLLIIRHMRVLSEESSPAASSIRLKLLLLIIALQISFLLLTHFLWSIFTKVPTQYKILCALDVISGSTPFLASIVKLSSNLIDPTSGSPTIIDGIESIFVQGVRVVSFLHLWYLHGVFSPMIFVVAYCISCSYESFCEFQEFLKVLKRINRFPSTQKSELCTICQFPLNDGKLLPCKHAFHKDCLEAWMRMKQECPNCRDSISLDDGDIESPKNESSPSGNQAVMEEMESETVPWGNSEPAASLSEVPVLIARYGFTLCIDLFSLVTPLHIGFVYERQRPAELRRTRNRNHRTNVNQNQDSARAPYNGEESPESVASSQSYVGTSPGVGADSLDTPVDAELTNDSSQIEFSYPSCFRCRYYSEELEEEAFEIPTNDAEIIFEA